VPLLGELEAQIAAAARAKSVALEKEAVAVDAVLERLRTERIAATEAVASQSDTEFAARHSELTARLDSVHAQLLALPTSVVEPPYVGVVIDEAALLFGAAVFGRVFGRAVIPRSITAATLTLEYATNYAYRGCSLLIRLVVKDALLAAQSAEELEVSLGAAATATHIDVWLKAEDAPQKPLLAEISADIPWRCVTISIGVPLDAPVGSAVCFGPLTVSGQPVAVLVSLLVDEVRGVRCVEPQCKILVLFFDLPALEAVRPR
jgi:hypothetical protein